MNKVEKIIEELKDIEYFHGNVDPVVEVLLDKFLKEWTGSSYPHLADTDENEGQRLRVQLTTLIESKEREAVENFLTLSVVAGGSGIIKKTTEQIRKEAIEGFLNHVYSKDRTIDLETHLEQYLAEQEKE